MDSDHVDVDPVSTYHPDTDSDLYPDFNADPDVTFHTDADMDPDPTVPVASK